MTRQKAVLLMMAPVAAGLKERKAEWEEIEELIDYFSDLYDKVVEMVPEEEDEINYEDEEDDGDMSGYHVSSIKSEPKKEEDVWGAVNEYMSTKHDDVPIISPVYDPSIVTPEDEEVINNYYKEEAKKEQYIPFEEEKQKPTREIKSKGSIL
jgi:hypothetical protein